MWMLDTNSCIYLIKRQPERVIARLREREVTTVGVSSITVAELQHGVAQSARPKQNALALAAFLAPPGVEPFADAAAAAYPSAATAPLTAAWWASSLGKPAHTVVGTWSRAPDLNQRPRM